MKVTICICPSCHEKGTKSVVYSLQNLVSEYSVGDDVELSGSVSVGENDCGVCVAVDDCVYTVTPENVEKFFKERIMDNL